MRVSAEKLRAAVGHLEIANFLNPSLLDRTAYLREHGVGIRSDETNGSYHNYQNHCQHDRIFRDILAALIVPELL
jgi:hypothetical protein